VALAFAAEGASVVVAGRTEHTLLHVAGEIRDRGGVALPVLCDVGINEQIDDAVETAASTFGTIDILVNAAHHNVRRGTLLDMPDEDVELLWTTGPRATLRFMRRSYPLLRGAKEAIRAISRAAAVEWGPDQIRVNVIAPYAESPSMIDDLALQGGAPAHITPLGRLGDAEKDVGRVSVFLAGPDASYLTGQFLVLDGGLAYHR
jgi:NAD(P)-dependent dehydrogenase (short-subunit alcohol dehydrogenase family)